jgi:DNA-binding XRE family transcriptional regulator
MTPEQVLKIAASQWKTIPTAEQIIAALEAAGLQVVQRDAMIAGLNPSMTGQEIKDLRNSVGMTQVEVAQAIGCDQQSVEKIENDKIEFSRYTAPIILLLLSKKSEPVDDPRQFVRGVMSKHGITANALAVNAGIASSTLTRALNNEDYSFTLSTSTLRKIKRWDAAQNNG